MPDTSVATTPDVGDGLASTYVAGSWKSNQHQASYRLPTGATCELAAALIDGSDSYYDPHPGGVVRRFGVQLSPGVMQVRSVVRGVELPDAGWALDTFDGDGDPGGWFDGEAPSRRRQDRRRITAASLDGEGTGSKSAITEWSRKSRLNMARVLAQLDWAGHIEGAPAGWRVQMLTLTLPGDWLAIAPDGATFKRLFRAWLERWYRQWGARWAGCWKLEFQGRGAPHLHLYGNAPLGREFREWLSRSWYEVCGSGDERHLRAGTGVDWREGIRATDPRRVALYFLGRSIGHNLGVSKEYQHRVPDEWRTPGKGPGRFWGHRGLERVTVRREISQRYYLGLRRLAARWSRANGRRIRAASRGRHQGFTLLHADAPAWIAAATRALTAKDPPGGAGPPGGWAVWAASGSWS